MYIIYLYKKNVVTFIIGGGYFVILDITIAHYEVIFT